VIYIWDVKKNSLPDDPQLMAGVYLGTGTVLLTSPVEFPGGERETFADG
jgi:hypothetical protein